MVRQPTVAAASAAVTHAYRKDTLYVRPIAWLIPLPGFWILGLLPDINTFRFPRGSTIVAGACAERNRVNRLSAWRELEHSLKPRRISLPLRRRWPLRQLDHPVAPSIEKKRLLILYKGKSAVLFFEAIAVIAALASLRGTMPAASGTLESLLALTALCAFVLGGTALAVHLAVIISRVTLSENRLRILDEHPFAFYLGVTQLVYFIGFLVGVFLQIGDGRATAGVLLTAGIFGTVCTFGNFILDILERTRLESVERFLWLLLFSGMVIAGADMSRGGESLRDWMALLRATAPLYVLASVLHGASLVRWLLKPYESRHISDRKISRRRRLLLAVLTLTAVLPLGGLFVPLWIYARYQWPAKVPVQ